MADDVDMITERAVPVETQATRKPDGPKANGHCHYCDAVIAARFCDVECRDAYEYERSRK